MGGAIGAGITAAVLVAGGDDPVVDVAPASESVDVGDTSDPMEHRRVARRMEALEDENRALRRQLRVRVTPPPSGAVGASGTAPGGPPNDLQRQLQAAMARTNTANAAAAAEAVKPEELLAAIRDTSRDAGARRRAFQTLLKTHPQLAKEVAAEMLAAGETDEQLRQYSLYALRVGAVEGQNVHPSVRAIAFDGGASRKERSLALSIVAVKSPDEGFPTLESLISSPDQNERKLGIEAALNVDTPRVGELFARNINRDALRPYVKPMVDVIARHKHKRWSVQQIVGAPDLPVGADLATAWASKKPDMGKVWVELTFRSAVELAELRVHETFNAGAIIEISAHDEDRNEWVILWTGNGAAAQTPRWFAPPLSSTDFKTRKVKLVLDTDAVKGWNEIDSAELIGQGGLRQWVQSARASSDYTTGK